MKCPVCQHDAPEGVWQCPECGDHLGQWGEMDSLAEQALRDGGIAARQGKIARAILCLAEACVLKPDSPEALRALADVLSQQAEYADAACYMERCASFTGADTDSALWSCLLGQAKCELGQIEEGKVHLQKAIELDPNCVRARECLDRLAGAAAAPEKEPGTAT